MDKDVEDENDEETETLPGAVDSQLPEFKDVPQTGDNAISNMGDEKYLKKIEEEEAKHNEKLEREKDAEESDDSEE